MRHFTGYVRMTLEFEVDDRADDLEVEEAFNAAIDEKIMRGFDSSVDYDYKED